ncbi:MAG: PKD domain-containing protein [Chlorobi bacterium]|nr:PKD domain-containing protein [Chlorobiota bacterium]
MDDKKRTIFLIIFIWLSGVGISFGQDCNITSKANDISPDKLCAPVTANWKITYRGVNDGGTGDIKIYIEWGDGNDTLINATLTDAVSREWTGTAVHVYPQDGQECVYHPTAQLVNNGTTCESTSMEQLVIVWDTDENNGGIMRINPTIFPICYGNDGKVTFADNSQWNCTPPDEPDTSVCNSAKRWIQWIYGTGGTSIDCAVIDGNVVSDTLAGPVEESTEPVYSPFSSSDEIYIPVTDLSGDTLQVGDYFEVTLRNWNYCNPYDDPAVPGPPADTLNGDFPPIETTAIAIIVALPDATIDNAGPFCENESPVQLTAATSGGTWSGPGIINNSTGIFDPETAGPGIHVITYSVSNDYNCSATDTLLIRVWPAPDAKILNSNPEYLCPGVIDTLDGNPTGGTLPYSHLWSGDTSPLDMTNTQTPEFSTSATGIYNLTYKVTDANSCTDTDTIDIHVYPVDIHFSNDTIKLCTNVHDTLKPAPSGGSGIYSSHLWTGTRTDLLSATDIENPAFISPLQGLFKYEYSVTDNQGCSASDSIFVQVFEQPVANAGENDTICGLISSLNATPSIGTGIWSKISGPGNIVFNDITTPDTEIDVDTYGTYILEWSENNQSCSDADTVVVVFYKTPEPVTNPGGDTCGLNYLLTVTPDYGTGYWKQKSGPGSATFDNNLDTTTEVSVSVEGDYVFEWIEANSFGCTGSDSVKVSFHQMPVAEISPFDSAGCSPVVINFVNNSTNADSYNWNFGDGSESNLAEPEHTFKNGLSHTDTFKIRLIAYTSTGCTDTTYKSLMVNPSPVSSFNADKGPGCSPLTVSFNNTSSGAESYLWTLSDGSPDETGETLTHTFINNESYVQSFNVTLTVENTYSCTDTSDMYITVYPLSKFEITADPDTGCTPLNVSLYASPGAYSYDWDFGDGQTTQGNNSVSHIYYNSDSSPRRYTTKLFTTSTFGCLDTSYINIVVNPVPESRFSPIPSEGCSPLSVLFKNESLNADSALWKFGDGNQMSVQPDSNVVYTYINKTYNPEAYKAILVVENSFGCADSSSDYITVNPEVKAIIDTADSGCSPFEVNIKNNSTGANEFFWNFGDGNTSTATIGKNIYINTSDTSATYRISMIARSVYGCEDTAYTSAGVFPQPGSRFSTSPSDGCAPLTVDFTNESGNVQTSIWRFGDGDEESFSGDSSTTHTYRNDGYSTIPYRVTLLTENEFGCKDSSSNTINVYPQVKAVISEGDNGCSPHEVAFTNSSVNANEFLWNFGDGNTSSEYTGYNIFVNTSTQDTTYTVILKAESSYGCKDYDTTTVTVYRVPNPDFTATPIEQQLPNSTVTVNDKTIGNNWDYTWLWGDGTSSTGKTPDPHTYGTYGNFDIKLIVAGEHCSDSTVQAVTIKSSMPEVIYGPDTAGCPPFTVRFHNRSVGADTYMWEFGDGGVSSKKEPVYTYRYPGEYKVKLTIYGPGGTAEKEDVTIIVFDRPTAYFEVVPNIVKIPGQQVSFLNRSTDAESCLWDLGDGNSSTEFSFMYEYQEEGVYDVSLEVKNDKGCKDTYIQREAVTAEKGGKIKFPNAFTPNPAGPNGGHYVYGDKENFVFYPFVQEGIAEYKLQIFTRWGELIFESNDIKTGWDGYYRGKMAPQGVYIYKATCKFGTGLIKVYTGDVTLLR